MILDFSVLREGDEKLLQTLQSAVKNKQVVRFTYTNNDGETRQHCVEPEHIKERIINSAKDILFLYDKL